MQIPFSVRKFFRHNRNRLIVAVAAGLAILLWMTYGAGRRAVGYEHQFDIKAPVVTMQQFLHDAALGKFKGATLYVRGDTGALVIGANGPSVSVPDFVDSVSQTALRQIRNNGILMEGEVTITAKPALPSAAQAGAAAFTETVARFGSAIMSIAFTVFFLFYIKGVMTSGGGLFGDKKYKVYDASQGDKLPVRLADVAGMEGPKKELSEVVDYLRNPARFSALGARAPKGVLLYGPPGNGKTLLAKAVAGEAGVPFMEQNASSFVQMFVGAGAASVRDLFREARKRATEAGGCVIFIDEIDAVGGQRGNAQHGEQMQTLNGLLAEMDGFGDNTGIVVIGATNRLESLDAAILRPGRFDRKVFIPLPGVRGRQEILAVHLKHIKKHDVLDVRRLAEMGAGMSGADLANWVNEAAIEAARRSDPDVTMEHFALARDRVLVGPRNFGIEMSEEEERAVAYHEAGHATVRHALGGCVDRVTIIPHGGALGVTFTVPDEKTRFTRESLQTELAVLMGGRAAEDVFTGSVSSGAASDIERASRMAFEGVSMFGLGDSDVFVPQTEQGRGRAEIVAARMLREAYAQAKTILEDRRSQVESLADRLVENKLVTHPFEVIS
jgi:cell division protease FtsH